MKNRKRLLLMLLYAALLSPWIATGAISALEGKVNSPLDWVDSSFQPRRQYDQFSEQFGAGDVVVISWPGCRLDESRLDDFVRSLRESSGFYDRDQWLFYRVTSGREILQAMLRPPSSVSYQEAVDRLRGSIVGPDGKTTCVVIGFNESGLKQRTRLVPLIRAAASRYGGAEYASQHLAGPIMDGYAVDDASRLAMNRFAPLSSIILFCVCLLCLDSLAATSLVFGISVLSQAVTLSILHYCGGTMTALLIVLPPLIQVLAIAGGIHLTNYYFDAAASMPGPNAIRQAIGTGWLPCVLSATTTAIGLGSLFVSGLVAVREFGVYAAVGVAVTVAALLSFLPGVITLRPLAVPKSALRQMRSPIWAQLTLWQTRYGGLIAGAAIVSMVALGFGVARLRASVRIETLFGQDSRLIKDYAWLEEHVGSLVPIEVVACFDKQCPLTITERTDLLRRIEKKLEQDRRVDAVTSCLDFLPRSPSGVGGDWPAQLAAPIVFDPGDPTRGIPAAGGSARSLLPAKEANYFVMMPDGAQKWRTTAHVSALGSTDYGKLLRELTSVLETEVLQATGAREKQVSLELSGLMPLVHQIQQQLLRDLFASFLVAFALIAVVMTIVQAGIVAGLLSMVPNVFPALTLFGLLGWWGHPIDIGSIMTASVAMGIAVDDTLHFLTFFQRSLDTGKDRRGAVLAAHQHCGRAIIQTTLICAAGLSMFAFSNFLPTARFAWMMVALLSAALVGDLIVLPSLLLGPVGRVFDRESPGPSILQLPERADSMPGHARRAG